MNMETRKPSLITLADALSIDKPSNLAFHRRHLNSRIADLCEIIEADMPLTRASGSFVWDHAGNRFIDFLSGFAALNIGHNHPVLQEAMDRVKGMVNLVEGLNTLAGALAHNLVQLAPGNLSRVFFANSGAEVIDASIKLARAGTGRKKLLACNGGFHGRTIGALSVNSREEFRGPFEPLLIDVAFIPYGDIESLEDELRRRDVAALILEPIQGEGGMVVPPQGYLAAARELCTRYGTVLIIDEIQTGLGRTGKMFAVEHEAVEPDVLLLGKALGGGVMPLSAVLTKDELWIEAGGGTPRSPFQTPTFGGNTRACAAGLATLEVLLSEDLATHAATSGSYLLGRLRELQQRHPLIANVRGRGLMIGIEFAPATRGLGTLLTAGTLNRLSREFLSGLVLYELRNEHRILTLATLNDPNVLRAQPPLNIERENLDKFVDALDNILTKMANFPRAALKSWRLLQRAVSV